MDCRCILRFFFLLCFYYLPIYQFIPSVRFDGLAINPNGFHFFYYIPFSYFS